MKIFISWSGERSKTLAEIFKSWLPAVIQAVQPYFTPDDIEKGARWNSEISKELEESDIGIICITPSNLQAPWLMFEAGALAKSINKSRVIPLLFGVGASDLQGPLLQFQATNFEENDIYKLVKTVNAALGENALDSGVLESVFEKWWPDLEAKVNNALGAGSPENDQELRTDREILEEILNITRAGFYGPKSLKFDPVFMTPIEDLDFNSVTFDCLKSAGISVIGELIERNEIDLLRLDGFGKRSLVEVKDVLASIGLSLGSVF